MPQTYSCPGSPLGLSFPLNLSSLPVPPAVSSCPFSLHHKQDMTHVIQMYVETASDGERAALLQARQRGENLLAASLADSESLDMDSIWLVVDAYKDAAILSREMDIVNEATAFSRCIPAL